MSYTFMLPSVRTTAMMVWLLCCQFVGTTFCEAGIYGTPNIQDCRQALTWIPYIQESDSNQAAQPRIFAEPQYMLPPFNGVYNAHRPSAIVQVPKIWKHSTYLSYPRITLLVYNPSGTVQCYE